MDPATVDSFVFGETGDRCHNEPAGQMTNRLNTMTIGVPIESTLSGLTRPHPDLEDGDCVVGALGPEEGAVVGIG
jgi:hypothetical protein